MKALKYIISTFFVFAVIWGCKDDEFGKLDFVSTAVAPTNVAALFKVTQDNTGLVSITPTADGAATFEIAYGDGTTTTDKISVGSVATHTFAEGSYSVGITAIGVTGLKTEFTKDLVVSFQAPQFGSDPVAVNHATNSKQVDVTVPGDTQFAMFFDVYFVENGIETIITANVGETVSYTYAEPGLTTIKVVLKGGAIATTEYTFTDFEVTEILQPVTPAPAQPGRQDSDYISIFSDSYTNVAGTDFNPFWWQATVYSAFSLDGDNMLNYANLNYQGIQYGATVNASSMEFVHLDVWTADLTGLEFTLISQTTGEKFVIEELVLDGWNSFDIPLSDFTDQGLSVSDLHQFKFAGSPYNNDGFGTIFVDNLYFWKAPSELSVLAGKWKLAPEANAFMVGDSYGSGNWWGNSEGDVTGRSCLFDDEYIFGTDGSFQNVLQGETWVEGWQIGSDGCGAPVAPHDGSANASFYYDEDLGTVTVTGKGAYLGIPKPYNAGELSNPQDAPDSITYDIVLSDDNNTMTLVLFYGAGYWTFKLVRDVPPIAGTWKLAPEANAFMVGDSYGSGNWWGNSEGDVTGRACLFDDEYVFSSNGSFQNVLQGETWVEGWQVGSDGCGTPVAPHDGSAIATWSYDEDLGTVTVTGTGAYLGIPKPYNGGELSNPADAPGSITYDVVFSDGNNTMTLVLYYGVGYWTFKLVKQ